MKLTKKLNEGFKRHIYWNTYRTIMDSNDVDNNNLLKIYLDAYFQRFKRFFVLAFDNTDNGDKKVDTFFINTLIHTKINTL